MCVWAPVCYALIGRAGLGGLLTGAGVPWSASCDCVDCVGREANFVYAVGLQSRFGRTCSRTSSCGIVVCDPATLYRLMLCHVDCM